MSLYDLNKYMIQNARKSYVVLYLHHLFRVIKDSVTNSTLNLILFVIYPTTVDFRLVHRQS